MKRESTKGRRSRPAFPILFGRIIHTGRTGAGWMWTITLAAAMGKATRHRLGGTTTSVPRPAYNLRRSCSGRFRQVIESTVDSASYRHPSSTKIIKLNIHGRPINNPRCRCMLAKSFVAGQPHAPTELVVCAKNEQLVIIG